MAQFYFQKVFRPSLAMFDVLIHLDPKQLPRKHEHLDYRDEGPSPMYGSNKDDNRLPVTDFDPPALYLKELRVRCCKLLNIHKCFIFAIIREWCALRTQSLMKIMCQKHVQMSILCPAWILLLANIKVKNKKNEIKILRIINYLRFFFLYLFLVT